MDDERTLSRLGKYEVRGVLGRGAMGTVYDGRDPVIERRVAIKTMPKPAEDDAEGQDALDRFKREAQAAGRLSHPAIVGVYDYGETENLAFIVTEFVDGRTLKQVMDAREVFATGDVVRIVTEILEGLNYSHGLGVVHRDIKPANIMLTGAGRIKIADFGIARIENSNLTQVGTVMGTPAYMSPEQFMGRTVDRRTDLYSTGVLLYQLLTGEKPFDGSLTAIMHKALNTTPVEPSKIAVSVPQPLDAVVMRGMARQPDDRFQTADAFIAALRAAALGPANPAPAGGEAADATMLLTPVDRPGAATAAPRPDPERDGTGSPVRPTVPAPPARGGRRIGVFAGVGAVLVAVAGGAIAFRLFPGGQVPVPPRTVVAAAPAASPSPSPSSSPSPSPSPPPSPPPSPGNERQGLSEALPGVPCSLAGVANGSGSGIELEGVAGTGTGTDGLRAAAARFGLPDAEVKLLVADRRYCGILDTLRSNSRQPDGTIGLLSAGQAGGPHRLLRDQNIVVSVRMPDYPGYLYATYVSSDGSTQQLVPGPGYPSRRLEPKQSIELGRPQGGNNGWVVGPPYGQDVIVVVASSAALPDGSPPASTTEAFRSALDRAMRTASGAGGQLFSAVIPVDTADRP